ncbi:MAG: carboxypeptidase-like regulatory domain-containing protein [Acidobacteriota bacterium]
MKLKISLLTLLAFSLMTPLAAQDRSAGGIKGKVRVETGTPAGVVVVIRQVEREITRVMTNKSGEFAIQTLPPGIYSLTFRKPGLSIGTIENIEVKAGKTRSLGDHLTLTIDEGAIAFVRGSVFSHKGTSVPGAKVELLKVQADGTAKKIDGRITSETGSFVFRLTPEPAKYRITVKSNGADPISKEVDIDGAAVYRVALSLPATP